MKTALLCLLAAQLLAAAEPPAFHFAAERYKLPNGLRVVLARDNAVPIAAVYVTYDVGARSQEQGQSGYAHLLEHLMLPNEYREAIEDAGGEAAASTHVDYTEFSESLPSERLKFGLWREAGRMRAGKIDEVALREARDAIAKEKQSLPQPYRAAVAERWSAQIFANPRNAALPVSANDDLAAPSPESAGMFYRNYYTPGNAVLCVAGDFEPAEAKKLIAQYFGDIPAQPQPKRPDLKEPARAQGTTATTGDPEATSPAVIVGWPAPARHTPDWYALCMVDALLTAGEDARLRESMAIDRGSLRQGDFNLGWPGSSSLDARDPAYYAGVMVYSAGFKASEILEQFQGEVDRIARDGVGRTELERLKDYLRFTNLGAMQTALSKARLLGLHELIDGDAGFVEKDYANLLNVTAEQIEAAARRYLTAGRRDSLAIEPGAAK